MESKVVTEMLADVPAGTRLRIVWKEDKISELTYLLGMTVNPPYAPNLKIDSEALEILRKVNRFQSWELLETRTIEVVVPERFDSGWFVERIAFPLESLEILS